jgi:hypothetical protein
MNTKFDEIIQREHEARIAYVQWTFQTNTYRDYEADYRARQARLFAAIDALTSEEAAAFGDYRRSAS